MKQAEEGEEMNLVKELWVVEYRYNGEWRTLGTGISRGVYASESRAKSAITQLRTRSKRRGGEWKNIPEKDVRIVSFRRVGPE